VRAIRSTAATQRRCDGDQGGWAGVQGVAHAAPPVDEADPQAKSLGYRKDTTKVDDKQYPKHTAAQKCSAWMKKPG
jgi:hypothetical protein